MTCIIVQVIWYHVMKEDEEDIEVEEEDSDEG
jgi:hypothetical protein